jgi:hypothetical protein
VTDGMRHLTMGWFISTRFVSGSLEMCSPQTSLEMVQSTLRSLDADSVAK